MNDVAMLDALQLLSHFRQRTLSPLEVMRAVLEKISRLNPVVNSVCALDEEVALSAARESERRWMRGAPRGMLDGVPVSVKDLIAVAGFPPRHGSKTSAAPSERADAPAVARLRSAGAILFGKTTTSEFGNKIVTDSPLAGATRNPWDPQRSSGGSSGGSAVAVALGMGPLSLATDGGGSIRIPACWSGVVGFKPSYGLVPVGAAAPWPALSTLGPIARSTRDAACMLRAMTQEGADGQAAIGVQIGAEAQPSVEASVNYCASLGEGVAGLRIAYCPAPAGAHVAPLIEACVRQAASLLEALGAHVCESEVTPLFEHYGDGRMHSVQWQVFFAQRVRQMEAVKRSLLDPDLLALANAGERVTTAMLADALAARHALTAAMQAFFGQFDLLLMPAFHCGPPPVPGLPADLRTAPVLTAWCNQTGFPAVSVPCGFFEGMPTGLQIIGPRGADALVLRAAHAYEVARGPYPLSPMAGAHPCAEERR